MKQLLIATRNNHKFEEMVSLLFSSGFELKNLNDFPNTSTTIEDQPTLEGNALKKAKEAYNATGILSLADDTGLECYYLELQPGIYSARFAGENASKEENNKKLLTLLKGVPPRRRNARFRTVIAIVGKGIEKIVSGKIEGEIVETPRGNYGFGYDSLFIPQGYKKTFAEMTTEEKNQCSHRARAINSVLEILKNFNE